MSNRPTTTQLENLARLLYSLLWTILLPFLLLGWLCKALQREAHVSREYLSRFGLLPQGLPTGGIWLHCASVGEVVAMQQLVERILQTYPGLSISISTNTQTGRERVTQLFAQRVRHFYLPYDHALLTGRVLNKLQPSQVVITEMELWPNLVHSCWQRQIPVNIVNGRMSEKSATGYLKLSWLIKPLLNKVHMIGAQGQRDADNYLRLGAPAPKVRLTNNIKFDLQIAAREHQLAAEISQQTKLAGRLLLVAGSTHDPEEQILLTAYLELAKTLPHLLLVIVPRHPQRFEQVKSWLTKQNIRFICSSQNSICEETTQVVLVDQMGVLRSYYALATIAFVGGSLAPRGGHNALEPAALGIPVLMGPSDYNNPQICQTLATAGALRVVEDSEAIVSQSQYWLQNPDARQQASAAALAVVETNRGAIDNTLAMLGLVASS